MSLKRVVFSQRAIHHLVVYPFIDSGEACRVVVVVVFVVPQTHRGTTRPERRPDGYALKMNCQHEATSNGASNGAYYPQCLGGMFFV
jgi:hypothetical protein